jgi:hypothetical protein
MMHLPGRTRPLLGTTLLLGCIALGAAGCPALEVDRPIALVPDDDWTAYEREILASAARCWNLEFGTQLSVGASDTIMQQVRVGYSDLICLYAAGRTETTLPVSVNVCPPGYTFQWRSYKGPFLFAVLLHELGHVLNIRPHSDDPMAVMAGSDRGYLGFAPDTFARDDHRLFAEANEGVTLTPTCQVRIELGRDPPGCSCRSW